MKRGTFPPDEEREGSCHHHRRREDRFWEEGRGRCVRLLSPEYPLCRASDVGWGRTVEGGDIASTDGNLQSGEVKLALVPPSPQNPSMVPCQETSREAFCDQDDRVSLGHSSGGRPRSTVYNWKPVLLL